MRKTLADCTAEEFLPAAYRVREEFHAYYHLIGVDALRAQFADKYKDNPEGTYRAYIWKLLERMMVTAPKETVKFIGTLAFLSEEEAQKLPPTEMLEILTACMTSQQVMDFFISLERLAGDESEGILRTLILLRLGGSGKPSSETESGNSTKSAAEG